MKVATMKKLLTGAIAIAALLGVSSCSSDKSSSDTTAAAASDTTVASADSTADSTATGDTATDGESLQDQAIAVMIAGPPEGVTLDDACFTTAMTGLSDADAQLIIDGGPTASPTLSAEGTALAGAAVAACGTLTSTTA
jgi:hypothetical protein